MYRRWDLVRAANKCNGDNAVLTVMTTWPSGPRWHEVLRGEAWLGGGDDVAQWAGMLVVMRCFAVKRGSAAVSELAQRWPRRRMAQ